MQLDQGNEPGEALSRSRLYVYKSDWSSFMLVMRENAAT